jgi:hypothetical protein
MYAFTKHLFTEAFSSMTCFQTFSPSLFFWTIVYQPLHLQQYLISLFFIKFSQSCERRISVVVLQLFLMFLFLPESLKRIGKKVFETKMPDLKSTHVRTDLQHNESMAQRITIDLRDTERIQIIL